MSACVGNPEDRFLRSLNSLLINNPAILNKFHITYNMSTRLCMFITKSPFQSLIYSVDHV